MQICEEIRWKGRAASRLANGVVELIALTGGGHLAALRFLEHDGRSSQNVLWESPWETADPGSPRAKELAPKYGPLGVGRFLASYTGDALCLDSFGGPSPEQTAQGLGLHGEAPVEVWSVVPSSTPGEGGCRWKVNLSVAQLAFEREIRLGAAESVAYVEETVTNQRTTEYAFDWVQHVTLGPPFLEPGESTLAVSTQRGITWPLDYDGGSLLANDREFSWPRAPRSDGKGVVDLRQPFTAPNRGFLASLQLDPRRHIEYLFAANWKMRLGVGYCFRRQDFPWMAVWEENRARKDAPWSSRVQARGMEFGTTPMPLGREENQRRGRIFDAPSWCVLPAGAKKTARYLIFLAAMPSEVQSVEDITTTADAIHLHGQNGTTLSIPARGCAEFLAKARA